MIGLWFGILTLQDPGSQEVTAEGDNSRKDCCHRYSYCLGQSRTLCDLLEPRCTLVNQNPVGKNWLSIACWVSILAASKCCKQKHKGVLPNELRYNCSIDKNTQIPAKSSKNQSSFGAKFQYIQESESRLADNNHLTSRFLSG